MVKYVKNSAIPISTMLGGVCCVPIAERKKEKEMTYLVKEVIITSREGRRAITVVRNKISSVCT